MKKITPIGVFTDRAKTESAIAQLRAAGISDTEISCIYTDKYGRMKEVLDGNYATQVREYAQE